MDIEQDIQAMGRAIEVFMAIAPEKTTTIRIVSDLLDAEVKRGARKSYMARLNKEFFKIAKNVLSKEKFVKFQSALDIALENKDGTAFLDSLLLKGSIDSAGEFQTAMDELDEFIQNNDELSESDEVKVAEINKLLLEFEERAKSI